MIRKLNLSALFAIILSLSVPPTLKSQTILNGDFEINTCPAGVDQINLSNAGFNSLMSNVTAFGSYGDMDIITTATYAGGPESGNWYVAFTGGGSDAIAMTLSTPLVQGNTYTICFWDKSDTGYVALPLEVGVSNSAISMGTIVYTTPNAALSGIWTLRSFTFTAPISAAYITCDMTGPYSLSNWTQADNFSICCNATVNLGNDTTICQGNTLTLNAQNPGSTYLWSTGATTQTIIVNSTGTYWVNVTSISCSATDTIHVTVAAPPVVHLGNDTTLCSPGNLTLDAGNVGATYLWSTGANTQTINVTTTGNYWVTASIGACVGTDTIHVTFNPQPVVNLGNDTMLCSGQPITLNAGNPGDSYLWSNGATTQTINPTVTSAYSVTVTAGSCTANDVINVTFNPVPVVNLGPDLNLCNISNVTLNAGNPGSVYLWSTGANTQTISVSTAGQYWVQVSNGTCVGSDTVNVTLGNSVIVNLGPDITMCDGKIAVLDAGNAGMTYHWSTGETTQKINTTITGTYWVNVVNGNCEASDTINVKIAPNPVVALGNDTAICPGDQVVIDAGKGYAGYSWIPGGESSHLIVVNQPGTYGVTITDSNGCTASGSIWLKQFCPSDMYVPSAFVPGGGINDVFHPVCSGVVEYQMYIFDRWGQLIYQSEDISTGWDGTFNGNPAPQGVYIYRIDYKLYDYDQLMKHTKAGTVTLIR